VEASDPATFKYDCYYDDEGRLVQKHGSAWYPTSPAFIASDSLYYYDIYDNLVKTEFNSVSALFEHEGLTLQPIARKYYYYEAQPTAGTSDGNFAIHAFPSPVNGTLQLYFFMPEHSSGEVDIQVIGIDGKRIGHISQFATNNSYITMDFSNYTSGIYYITASLDGMFAYQNIFVQ